ncbi:MAG: DNA alkylation repair protein [Faecousia sp.]
MTYDNLKTALRQAADPTLEAYQRRIISDSGYPMYCIRMPALRKLARECAKEDLDSILNAAAWDTYEEVLVLGLAVAYEKICIKEKLPKLWRVLPMLDSWAMTDSISPTIRPHPSEQQLLWDFAVRCLESDAQYTRRFGIVILLNHFMTEQWIPMAEQRVAEIYDERYYVQMAQAWLLAEMAVSQPERVFSLLEQRKLSLFVHNMTIRKMRESFRIPQEQKQRAAMLRRKEQKDAKDYGN